jgi:adenosylcobyric acid synthase
VVREALDRLRATHDLVVIEGAGSPAEINLKDRDLVNMFVAEIADAPVILVSDIDRGGVFAALVGTMELLEPHERARVKALLINKFRGDVSLLLSGLDFLEKRTGVPVLGVLPYVQRLRIADEDSASLDARRAQRPRDSGLDVAVIRLPRIANYDDFEPLEHEPGMGLRFVEHADALSGADLVILPGTKSTMADLAWLRETGFADALAARLGRREPVLGICGGCQMLGTAISDPEGIESDARLAEGLGFLPFRTEFGRDKRTAQVRARAPRATFLAEAGAILSGYEIHMGRLVHANDARAAFVVLERNGLADDALDGGVNDDGSAIGTMLHGIFENAAVRSALTAHLRRRKGLPILDTATEPAMDEFDRLAETVRGNVNMDRLRALVGR